jgi:hypothetical protein
MGRHRASLFTRKNVLELCNNLCQEYAVLLATFRLDAAGNRKRELDATIFKVLDREAKDSNDSASNRLFAMLMLPHNEKWIQEHKSLALVKEVLMEQGTLAKRHTDQKLWMLKSLGFRRLRDVQILSNIRIYSVDLTDSSTMNQYPVYEHFYAHSESAQQRWKSHFAKPRADVRISHKNVDILDLSKFQYIVEATDSAIFLDNATGLPLLIVIRDWVRDANLLRYFNSVIEANVYARRNVRVHEKFIFWFCKS